MKIIIPMAGMGKRLRPHTLTTPKPLINLAGKPIVEHLIDEIVYTVKEPIEEIAFIVGHLGSDVEAMLMDCAANKGAKGRIYYQEEALGTAHAIFCAAPSLDGSVIIAFADTIFFADFKIKSDQQALIWTKKVENPEEFGVVLTDKDGKITAFREKPKDFVSDQAIIGIYYFKDGPGLRDEIRHLIDNNISKSGEYQLTDALENMKEKGLELYSAPVDHWLDCGNKKATVDTNSKVLEHKKINYIDPTARIDNATIIPPCFIGSDVIIENAVIGPCVSVGEKSCISRSVISHSIIQKECKIVDIVASNSMIGNSVKVKGSVRELDMGDYSGMN